MNPLYSVIFILFIFTTLSFQNCAQNYDVEAEPLRGLGQPLTEAEVEHSCTQGAVKKKNIKVDLPDPGACDWGRGGNRSLESEGEGKIRARHEQIVQSGLPASAKVCKLEFDFPSSNISYDDQLIFHMNGLVFASTFSQMLYPLDEVDGLKIYDWSKIVNMNSDPQGADIYCLGRSQGLAMCQIPASETSGRLNIEMDPRVLYKLSAAKPLHESLYLGLVTTGDNDGGEDCRHSRIQFDLDIHYVD